MWNFQTLSRIRKKSPRATRSLLPGAATKDYFMAFIHRAFIYRAYRSLSDKVVN